MHNILKGKKQVRPDISKYGWNDSEMFIHRYCYLQKVQNESGQTEFQLADLNKIHFHTTAYRPEIVYQFIYPLTSVKGLSFNFLKEKFEHGYWRVPTQRDVLKYACHVLYTLYQATFDKSGRMFNECIDRCDVYPWEENYTNYQYLAQCTKIISTTITNNSEEKQKYYIYHKVFHIGDKKVINLMSVACHTDKEKNSFFKLVKWRYKRYLSRTFIMNSNYQDIKTIVLSHYPTNLRNGINEQEHQLEVANFVMDLAKFVKKYIIDELGNFTYMCENDNDKKTTFHVHRLLGLLENHDYNDLYKRTWTSEHPSDQLRIFWMIMSFHMNEGSNIKLKLQELLQQDLTYGKYMTKEVCEYILETIDAALYYYCGHFEMETEVLRTTFSIHINELDILIIATEIENDERTIKQRKPNMMDISATNNKISVVHLIDEKIDDIDNLQKQAYIDIESISNTNKPSTDEINNATKDYTNKDMIRISNKNSETKQFMNTIRAKYNDFCKIQNTLETTSFKPDESKIIEHVKDIEFK